MDLTEKVVVCMCVRGVRWGLPEVGGSVRFYILCKTRAGGRGKAVFLLEDCTHTHTVTHTERPCTDIQHAVHSVHLIFCGPEQFLQEAGETSHHGRRYEELLCR